MRPCLPASKWRTLNWKRTPSFSVNRIGEDTGITFAGVPLGHEFTSLVLALLQVSGRAPKVDQTVIDQIKNVKGEYHFESYISLTCHNCPDVVQALNIMSLLNDGISHTMIDGAAFKDEVESKEIMAVPTVFLNGEEFGSGRMTLEEMLNKMGSGPDAAEFADKDPYDVLVVGGGPAGASAAIYAARKGIRTGLVAERFGGQVMDTLGIENFISMTKTEGPKLVASLEEHVKDYNIDVMNLQRAKSLEKKDLVELELENGAVLKSKTVILSTGARWRNVGVPGEAEFKNKGVAYCPHCDGPLFEGKDVAVIGGGNSGVEAAIDLAGIVKHVTVLEFMPELKADAVLQERLNSLPNVTIVKNAQTKEITGTDKVNGITYIDRATEEEHHVELAGVFVQIGLVPNTEWLGDSLEKTRMGELVVDKHGATSMPGVFAAGDCTDSAYKQIIISMGSGATASLGAFDYMIRN
ncbi:alkyl hydroperoxide reductase subunit F [Rossellomorea marisflavi]